MPELQPYRVRACNLATRSDNKIHDDRVARAYGFAGGLVPGVDVFAYMTHPAVAAWGQQWLRRGGMRARFRRPVYDGDEVSVVPTEAGTAVGTVPGDAGEVGLEVRNAAGTVCAVGAARRLGHDRPDVVGDPFGEFPAGPPPSPRPQAAPGAVRPGPMGSIEVVIDPADQAAYLDGIGEPLETYRDGGPVHPGLLLHAVNRLLIANVELGAWIHTASDCTFHGLARLGQRLSLSGRYVHEYIRGGHSYLELDAQLRADDTAVARVHHVAIYVLAPHP